jgi:hypothetical protein
MMLIITLIGYFDNYFNYFYTKQKLLSLQTLCRDLTVAFQIVLIGLYSGMILISCMSDHHPGVLIFSSC